MISNPTPQRRLHGHLQTRPAARLASSGEHQAALAHRLTARDRWLARMLYEHRVLTSHQIADIAFPSIRSTNHRLLDLYRWRVIDRFQPFTANGTQPMHYVLDVAGAAALISEDGLDPATFPYRHDRAIGIAYSLQLAHDVGCNGIFTSLINASCRATTLGVLTTWWSAARCARHFGDIVRPDGYGRWRTNGGRELEWFLEFDFGTEAPQIVAVKIAKYQQLATKTGLSTPVLFWFPSTRRETTIRNAIASALASLDQPQLVPVATGSTGLPVNHTPDTATTTAGRRWLPLTPAAERSRERVDLAELAQLWPTSPQRPATTSPTTTSEKTPTELAPPRPLPPDQPQHHQP